MASRKRKFFQAKASVPDPLDALNTLRKKQRIQEDHSLTKREQHDYQLGSSIGSLIDLLSNIETRLPDSVVRQIAEFAPAAIKALWQHAFTIYCRTLSEVIIHPKMATQALRTQTRVSTLIINKNAELCELSALADIIGSKNSTSIAAARTLKCHASHWRHIQHLWSLLINVENLTIDCNKSLSLHHVLLRCSNLRHLRLKNLDGELDLEHTIKSEKLETLILHFTESAIPVDAITLLTPRLKLISFRGDVPSNLQIKGCCLSPTVVISGAMIMPLLRSASCIILEHADQKLDDDIILAAKKSAKIIALTGQVSDSSMTTHIIRQIFLKTSASTLILPVGWPLLDRVEIDCSSNLGTDTQYDPSSFETEQTSISKACLDPLPHLRRLLPARTLHVLRVDINQLIGALEEGKQPPHSGGAATAGASRVFPSTHASPSRCVHICRWADNQALELIRELMISEKVNCPL